MDTIAAASREAREDEMPVAPILPVLAPRINATSRKRNREETGYLSAGVNFLLEENNVKLRIFTRKCRNICLYTLKLL